MCALDQKSSLIGTGRGLDHVIAFVRDLEAAKDAYRRLGFWVLPPGDIGILESGQAYSEINFRGNYLELRAIHDHEKAIRERPRFVNFLQSNEGAMIFVLNVSPIESTIDFLRRKSFRISDSVDGEFFSYATFENFFMSGESSRYESDALPTRVISFCEYAPSVEERFRRKGFEEWQRHTNTAVRIKSVWIAVRNIEVATETYQSIGLQVGQRKALPEIGAVGQEIKAGTGLILLLQPTRERGQVAWFLADRGEGIMGVSIEVRDFDQARDLLEKKTGLKSTLYSGAYGRSLLITPEWTHGVCIEFIGT